MGEIREGVSESVTKKKHKKRKSDESRVLGVEESGVVELDEGGSRKKGKTDVVGVKGLESDVRVDIGAKEGENGLMVEDTNRSDKKKKKKHQKVERSGSGDVSGDLKGTEAASGMNGENLSMETREKACVEDAKMIEVDKVKKKGKKEKSKKSKVESSSIGGDDIGSNEVAGHISSSKKTIVSESTEEVEQVKKKKKKQKEDVCEVTEIEERAKGKKPKKNKSDVGTVSVDEELKKNTHVPTNSDGESTKDKVGKKRKQKSVVGNSENNASVGAAVSNEGNEGHEVTEPFENSNLKKKTPKKVKFADSIEVFSIPDTCGEGEENTVDGGNSSKVKKGLVESEKEDLVSGSKSSQKARKPKDGNEETNLVRGKRFTKEEDELIRNAVLKYIEDRRLGEDGLKMVLKCKTHGEKVKDCWNVIMEAVPWRHKQSIYCRAHILFERSENRTWTKEELEEVRKYHEKYGPKWRALADELGRNRIHVKDAFRQVRLPDKKSGHWSQEEYQKLFDLVNKDLRIRANMDRKSQHGMLRDNIGWEAISQKLTTRTDPVCCMKWYNQLTSSLVVSGMWADTDDYRLLMALDELDATCEEEVEWDLLLEHRSGDVCRKRWSEMVRHIGEHGKKTFSEQVETLSQRYCPDVLDARETYDSKPFVDV